MYKRFQISTEQQENTEEGMCNLASTFEHFNQLKKQCLLHTLACLIHLRHFRSPFPVKWLKPTVVQVNSSCFLQSSRSMQCHRTTQAALFKDGHSHRMAEGLSISSGLVWRPSYYQHGPHSASTCLSRKTRSGCSSSARSGSLLFQ